MKRDRITIIGAGMAGLVASLVLSARGFDVTVIEQAGAPGGKMREVEAGGRAIDAGPTVFTLKPIFQAIFDSIGHDFDACVPTQPVTTLARHAWSETEQFDLFADVEQSRDAIAQFVGAGEARGFDAFRADAKRVWQTLERSFVHAPAPSMMGLLRSAGLRGLPDLAAINPFTTLWSRLGRYFHDQRLRQLFARYATYCGSSPFAAPATLMLVAHVEQEGVWTIDGGMHRLARVIADLATLHGAKFHFGAEARRISLLSDVAMVTLADGNMIASDRIIFNGDPGALAGGLLGEPASSAAQRISARERSLSAITWAFTSRCQGFRPRRHNVFFSRDYRAEFQAIESGRYIEEPTVYLCAQDHDDADVEAQASDRYLALINAPATGDMRKPTQVELTSWTGSMVRQLEHCGLTFDTPPQPAQATAPDQFDKLFPATGGALYGRASHGWRASFQRPTTRTRLPRLYLAGGGIHPGPGIPMAALSGWTAAQCVIADSLSPIRSRGMAIAGGMSTRSPMTGSTG